MCGLLQLFAFLNKLSLAAKGLGLISLAFAGYLVAFAAPLWYSNVHPIGMIGLWTTCKLLLLVCEKNPDEGWLQATQAFACLGLIALFAAVITTSLGVCCFKEKKVFKIVGAGASVTGGVCILIAASIYGAHTHRISSKNDAIISSNNDATISSKNDATISSYNDATTRSFFFGWSSDNFKRSVLEANSNERDNLDKQSVKPRTAKLRLRSRRRSSRRRSRSRVDDYDSNGYDDFSSFGDDESSPFGDDEASSLDFGGFLFWSFYVSLVAALFSFVGAGILFYDAFKKQPE